MEAWWSEGIVVRSMGELEELGRGVEAGAGTEEGRVGRMVGASTEVGPAVVAEVEVEKGAGAWTLDTREAVASVGRVVAGAEVAAVEEVFARRVVGDGRGRVKVGEEEVWWGLGLA